MYCNEFCSPLIAHIPWQQSRKRKREDYQNPYCRVLSEHDKVMAERRRQIRTYGVRSRRTMEK